MSQDVLFEELSGRDGNLGVITLNRPQVLNALNHNIFLEMSRQLTEWETTDHIKAVIVKAVEGRAFCAGGDIRSAYEKKMAKDPTLPYFFSDEYRLDLQIYRYAKPYIALLDGITMGGGAGISINGSHRVATERLVFAMPETGIGFYPDVGASYFLSRLPYKIGVYLGLTGARIGYQDCAALGLVTHVVPKEKFSDLIYALADTVLDENARATVSGVIEEFSVSYPAAELLTHKNEIESCFNHNSIEEIFIALEKQNTEWCRNVLNGLKTKSPTSLKVTLEALKRGAKLDFSECMQMENNLTRHFLENHDFMEGVRAVIIDKDQSPKWQPASLGQVSTENIDQYFETVKES